MNLRKVVTALLLAFVAAGLGHMFVRAGLARIPHMVKR